MPFEILSGYTKSDPNGYILFPAATPAGSMASADINAPADSDAEAILYKDATAGHFVRNTGWTHLFTFRYTDTTGNGKCFGMCYSNNIGDFRTHKNNGWPGCGIQFQSDGAGKVDINVFTAGANMKGNGVTGAFNENTVVYGKIVVDANNVTVFFYSDAARTQQIATDTVAHDAGEPATYQYFYAMSNENKGSTGREWGFEIWDVDLQEVSYQVTETLQDSAGVALADGINVVAVEASTFASGQLNVVGSAAIAGGAGSVTITVTTGNDVMLIPDPVNASMPPGSVALKETVIAGPITPTVV
jgi:hypothetical protein